MLCYLRLQTPNNGFPMMCLWHVQVGEEVKFDPQVMVERLHRQQTFHQAQLEHGDILLVQAVLPEVCAPCCLIWCKWPAQTLYKQWSAQPLYQQWNVWTMHCSANKTQCISLAQGDDAVQLASDWGFHFVFMHKEHCLCICKHNAVSGAKQYHSVHDAVLQQWSVICTIALACYTELMPNGCSLLQEQLRGLKHPQAKDFLNYVKWRQTVHFKKLENPKVGASSVDSKQLDWQAESLTTQTTLD